MRGDWQGCRVESWPHQIPNGIADVLFFGRLLARFRPQCVIGNFDSVTIAMVLGRLFAVPVRIAWYRSLMQQRDMDYPPGRLKGAVADALKRLALHSATHLVPVSDVGKRDLIDYFGVPGERCTVFHTCRPDHGPNATAQNELTPEEPVKIVFVGRLEYSKGHDVLIRAMAELKKRPAGRTFRLEILGGGSRLAEYQALTAELQLEDSVCFPGQVSHEEVYKRLGSATLLAVPIRSDIGPGVIPEALCAGLPVVAAASGGMPTLLGSSEAVRFVPVDDPCAMADAIVEVTRDPDRLSRMREAARALFLEKFDLRHWVRDVSDWIEALDRYEKTEPSRLKIHQGLHR